MFLEGLDLTQIEELVLEDKDAKDENKTNINDYMIMWLKFD